MVSPKLTKMVPSSAIILSLPDEILIEILSRVPLNDLTSIPFVCRRFSNPDFFRHRLIPTLHIFGLNPDGDDGDDEDDVDDGVSLISVSVPLNTSNWSAPIRQPLPRDRGCKLVSLGRCVYIIGLEEAFCHDTWTKTTVPVACPPSPCVCVAAINGKLYACTSFYGPIDVNEYDPGADEWRALASSHVSRDGLDNVYLSVGVGAGGVFYLSDMYGGFRKGYDVTAGQWVGNIPGPLPSRFSYFSACGTPAGHLYVISSFGEEELGFWRWEGSGEEWITLEPPMVPPTPGYIGRRQLRFRCVAVWDERVVTTVNVSHVDIVDSSFIGTYIFVYSVVDGSWSRGPDLPFKFKSIVDLAFTEY